MSDHFPPDEAGAAPGRGLVVAYIVNRYPSASATFIRREIQALERLGVRVERITMKSGEIAGDEDRLEAQRTRQALERGWRSLALPMLAAAVRRPRRFAAATAHAVRLNRRTGRPLAVHAGHLAQACRVAAWVRRSGVGHLHAHFGTNSTDIAALVSELTGLPYSFTVHGPDEFDRPGALNLTEKVRRAAFVVAISSFGRSQVFRWIDYGEWPKVHVVRCGLDAAFRDHDSPDPPENRTFVCIGRLSEQKGQELLVEATALLRDRGVDCDVVLVGDGEMRDEIEHLVKRLDLGDRVTLTGWCSSLEVRDLLLASRALILTSFAEGLPVVLMEAMALRRPVLSTCIAGVPELVADGESGWLFPAGDVGAIADAIVRCLDTSAAELATMGANARRRVLGAHDVDVEARHLVALIANHDADRAHR